MDQIHRRIRLRDILKGCFRVCRENPLQMAAICLSAGLLAAVAERLMGLPPEWDQTLVSRQGAALLLPPRLYSLLVGFAVYTAVDALGQGIMTDLVWGRLQQGRIDLIRSCRATFEKTRPLIGANLISGGAEALLVLLVYNGVARTWPEGFPIRPSHYLTPVLILLAGAWAAGYVLSAWAFVSQAVMVEGCASVEALQRSQALSKGCRLRVLWVVVGIAALMIMAMALIALIPVVGQKAGQWLMNIAMSLAALVLYIEVRTRKERLVLKAEGSSSTDIAGKEGIDGEV